MAEYQAIQRELPGVGVVGRCLVLVAVSCVQAPACAGLLQPAMQAVVVHRFQPAACQRGAGQQVQHFVQPARDRQAQQMHEHIGQRLARQRTAVGQRIRNAPAAATAEHCFQVRHIDRSGASTAISRACSGGSKRGSCSRLRIWSCSTCNSRRRVWQACTLQAGVVAAQAVAQFTRGQRATMEQVTLQAMQQAVGQATFVQAWPGVLLRSE